MGTRRLAQPPGGLASAHVAADCDGIDLGSLWLCSYVHRDDLTEPVCKVDDYLTRARQLQVKDIDDERIQVALTRIHKTDRPSRPTSWALIQELADRYKGCEAAVFIAPAWRTPEGPVLIEGNHRARAIYLARVPRVEVDLVWSDPTPWCPDTLPGLRSLGPF